MSVKFYQEELGVSEQQALRIMEFMKLCHRCEGVVSAKPWVKNGTVRVYIDFWSQNKRPPFDTFYDKNFYSPDDNEFYLTGFVYQQRVKACGKDCLGWKSGAFNGAKTREKIKSFLEEFYNEKANWNICS